MAISPIDADCRDEGVGSEERDRIFGRDCQFFLVLLADGLSGILNPPSGHRGQQAGFYHMVRPPNDGSMVCC